MDRLHSMARFDPTVAYDPKPVDCCEYCGRELYEGQEVVFDKRWDFCYCDVECLRKHLKVNIDDEIHDYVGLLIEQDVVYSAYKTKEGVIR